MKLLYCGSLHGHTSWCLRHVVIPYSPKCLQIACGKNHILCLLDGGLAASFGSNYFGQLGHGDENSSMQPKIITNLEPRRIGTTIKNIYCGSFSSAVITEQAHLFMWGLNVSGQCGRDPNNYNKVLEPRLVDTKGARPLCLSSGKNHSLLLTEEGRVYSWGAGNFGRLGLSEVKKKHYKPQLISSLSSYFIESIASGDYHNLALTSTGAVYSWGYNNEGQCGHQSLYHLRCPVQIEKFQNKKICKISCGGSWSCAITAEGTLYTWGDGEGYWLGHSRSGNLPTVDPENTAHTLHFPKKLKTFDSDFVVTCPLKVRSLSNYVVEDIRCGGSQFIVMTRKRKINDVTGGKSLSNGALNERENESEEEDDEEDGEGEEYTIGTTRLNSVHKESDEYKEARGGGEPSGGFKQARGSDGFKSEEFKENCFRWCRHNDIARLSHACALSAPEMKDFTDQYGNSLLIVACQNGHLSICKLLVDSVGVDINHRNHKGNTALHYCFAYQFQAISQYLISKGADDFATNLEGLTCYEGLSREALEAL